METAARDRRRLARPPRLPRTAEVDPLQRARRLLELPHAAVGGGAARVGARRLGLARDADLPPQGAAGVPVGPRVRGVDPRAARDAARARRVVRLRRREGGRVRGRRLPRRRGASLEGPVLVATSDRDAFQLVNDHVTILQPIKGVSELARIGVPEVRERYGVEPEQVPDFIALRGDPSDKIPGAPGVGPKKAADVLKPARLARASARRRPLPADRGRASSLPRHRDDGRRRAAAEARRRRRRTGSAPRRTHRSSGWATWRAV